MAEQPKPVPRKPRIRTQSHPGSDQQPSIQHGELEQTLDQMNLGDAKVEIQRLTERVADLRREEQRLRELISQLQCQQTALQEGGQKERELMEREHAFYLRQESFRSEMSDKEFVLNNREWELRRLEDQLNAQKKEMALAKFDEECEGPGMSSAQMAKIADKERALQRQEERLQQKEMELNDWALRLDRQAKDNHQRLMEVEQREANVHAASAIPGGEGITQPHPPWRGETVRHQTYPSTNTTYYQGQQQQSPSGAGYSHGQPGQQWYPSDRSIPARPTGHAPHAPNVSTTVGTHSSSPDYQHSLPQYSQHQVPSSQYQGPGFYQQQQQSSPSPGVAPGGTGPGAGLGAGPGTGIWAGPGAGTGSSGIAHSGQTQIPGTPPAGNSSQLVGSSGVVFSVGEGGAERNNLGASSNSVASAMAGGNSSGQPVATSLALDQSEECARGLQWEEQSRAKHQEDSDLELARRLQEEFDAEARGNQHNAATTDELLALQLQHEDLKVDTYGSGLTHDNQLTGEGDGSEVTEVVKKALDERITRQHQIREQEEADRRIAETISSNDLGDPATQANLQNNLSS